MKRAALVALTFASACVMNDGQDAGPAPTLGTMMLATALNAALGLLALGALLATVVLVVRAVKRRRRS